MAETILTFLLGVLSGVFGNYLFARFTRRGHSKANAEQWERIQRVLLDPKVLRSRTGGGTLAWGFNNTPWTLTVEPLIMSDIGHGGWMQYSQGKEEWKPNVACWVPLEAELLRTLDEPTSKVVMNISYEPVHKNIGVVELTPVGERVHIFQFDTKFSDRWGNVTSDDVLPGADA